MAKLSRENNFDLIRLIAAIQVVFWHSYEHLHFTSENLNSILYSFRFFPGVPIFFTISGFLIYASFERNSAKVTKYFKNRFLRIFPGLWFVFIFTFVVLFVTRTINLDALFSKQMWLWVLTQLSIFQFYTPEILRSFGVGTPNGSLWTIFIEFSFYIFLPIFFFIVKKTRFNRILLILIFVAISSLYNHFYFLHFIQQNQPGKGSIEKLLGLNLLPFLFYFLIGALIYEKWDRIKMLYIGKHTTTCI